MTSSGEHAHEETLSDKILIGYAPTTTYNNDGQPTKRNTWYTNNACAMTCFLCTHVYTTTSAKGFLRLGTKAGTQFYSGSKILEGPPSLTNEQKFLDNVHDASDQPDRDRVNNCELS